MRDDLDAVVADRFKVLDQVPVPDTWARVQRSGKARPAPTTAREELTMIDLETPVPNTPRQKGPLRVVVGAVLAAAAVVAIALVVSRDGDDGAPVDQPSPTVTVRPTVTVPPTVPAQALLNTPSDLLEPGTYFVDSFEGTPTPRVHFTIGSGWSKFANGWAISKKGGNLFNTFSRPDAVLADACHPSNGYHPGPLTTLDGLVAALSEQQGWAEVTNPSDISIDGYTGKAFQRTAPADFSGCTRESAPDAAEQINYPMFSSWENVSEGGTRGWSYYRPGETETLWVLDVDGTIVILNARVSADQNANDHAEAAAYLDSIRIDRG